MRQPFVTLVVMSYRGPRIPRKQKKHLKRSYVAVLDSIVESRQGPLTPELRRRSKQVYRHVRVTVEAPWRSVLE